MTAIRLDAGEVMVAHQVATLREYVNAAVGVIDRRADGDALGATLGPLGYIGELAFAKWRGIYPDMTATPRSGTADFDWAGFTWDVKATKYSTGDLICPLSSKADAQLFALAVVQQSRGGGYCVRFPGWAYRDELIRPERISEDPKYPTPCYAMKQGELHSWREKAA